MSVGPVARNSATGIFFDGTAQGRFLLRCCRPGSHYNRPQATVCSQCGSADLGDVEAGGGVSLVSWAVIPDRPRDDRPAGPPNIAAIVEFDEGPWWWSKVVGADPADLEEGQRLRIVFERAEGGEAVPVFTPDGGDGRP